MIRYRMIFRYSATRTEQVEGASHSELMIKVLAKEDLQYRNAVNVRVYDIDNGKLIYSEGGDF